MATTNITGNETQTKTFEGPECFSIRVAEFKQQSVSFSAANIFLSILATLGNSLILVALHKVYFEGQIVKGISPSAIQSLVSLSGNNWSFDWSYYPASLCYLLVILGSRTLESLSILFKRNQCNRLCVMFSFIVDADGHKRGSTSRSVVETEIQRDCNFEAHVYHLSYLLVYIYIRWFILTSQLHYNHLVQLYNFVILLSYLHCLIHKDFPRSQSSSGSNTRSCSTTAKPTKSIKHGAIQKGSVQCTVGTVSFSCLLCTTYCSQNCVVS